MNSIKPTRITAEAESIWRAGVAAVDARRLVRQFVTLIDDGIQFGKNELVPLRDASLLVVGAGKASGWMAQGLESVLTEAGWPCAQKLSGHVNVTDDQVAPCQHVDVVGCRPSGSNFPTEKVVRSTAEILRRLKAADPDDLVVVLISGGASALLELPRPPVTLDDILLVTRRLSQAGVTIEELNCVRRRLSQVKAGGLVRFSNAQRVVGLIVSDVLGDPLDIIGSGPTVIPNPGFESIDPRGVIEQAFPSADGIPSTVLEILNQPLEATRSSGRLPVNYVIGNLERAVEGAAAEARAAGFEVECEIQNGSESVRQAAERMTRTMLHWIKSPNCSRCCLVSGGEPTISLPENPGRGGRNQHLVLEFAHRLLETSELHPERFRFAFLAGGTDGEDGNVSVAGGWVDSQTLQRILVENDTVLRDPLVRALQEHDSHRFLRQLNGLLEHSPTRTNVCDLRILAWQRLE